MTLLTEKPEVSKLDLMTADPDALRDYAVELAGRPVPGVRMSAEEFEAWAIDHADAEWVDGRIILMAPANTDHETIDEWLGRLIGTYVEKTDAGRVLRNVLVRLSRQRRKRVPDLMLIAAANLKRIKPTFIDGPPDLVVEIVSPDSVNRDRRDKYLEYEKASVGEYWIIDPLSDRLDLYLLHDGKFREARPEQGRLSSGILPGFYVRPSWLFGETLPKVRDCLAEIEAAPQKPAQPQPPPSA